MSALPLVKLVCPACKSRLAEEPGGWRCSPCRRRYAYSGGVLCFLTPEENFNPTEYKEKQEQAWSSTAQLRDRIRTNPLLSWLNHLRIRWSLSGRRDRLFYDEMHGGDPRRLILDVGCGGGRHYFCQYGQVIGIDAVLDLLQISKTIYAEVYQASAMNLPFADGSFDYVVSSDVIGHVPFESKDTLFAEMYRVLKPGGRTVHVIETDSTNRWFQFAHQYPELFHEYLVERPGHIGLELPSALRQRFLKHGFKEVAFKRIGGTFQECGSLTGFFGNEYSAHSPSIRRWVALDRLLSRNLLVRESVNVLLEPLAKLDDRLSPFDYCSGALVVFEK